MSIATKLSLSGLTLALLLAGCSSAVKLDEPAKIESRSPDAAAAAAAAASAAAAAAAQASATPQSQVTTVDLARQRAEQEANAAAAALARVMYFDFDSFSLREEYRPLIESHARVLTTLKGRRLAAEGHADERGGREYNLALGQKRAEAVARALELLGVSPGQVEAVSFGEERPAAPGHDEAAWAKNRRVELKDR